MKLTLDENHVYLDRKASAHGSRAMRAHGNTLVIR